MHAKCAGSTQSKRKAENGQAEWQSGCDHGRGEWDRARILRDAISVTAAGFFSRCWRGVANRGKTRDIFAVRQDTDDDLFLTAFAAEQESRERENWNDWLSSENRQTALTQSFPALQRMLTDFLSSRGDSAGVIRLLPPSAPQLARRAEDSNEFYKLVDDLFRISDIENDEERGFEFQLRIEELSELLRRSGYYHALIKGDEPKLYWEKIADRVPFASRKIRHFRVLDGCRFARERFDIDGYSIVRPSAEEIEALGPSPEVSHDFYRDEILDSQLAKSWMLAISSEQPTGYLNTWGSRSAETGFLPSSFEICDVTEIAAGISESTAPRSSTSKQAGQLSPWHLSLIKGPRIPVLPNDYLRPILVLSLYDHRFFQVPLAFISEAGWKIIKFVDPSYRPSRWRPTYEVEESAWSRFEMFIKTLETAFLKLDFLAARGAKEGEEVSRRIVLGTKHYLKATFAAREIFPGWMPSDYVLLEHPEDSIEDQRASLGVEGARDEALLNYVVTLEALLVLDRSEPVTDTVATRSALFVGRNDDEKHSLHSFIKKVYRARSDLVHGHGSSGAIDLVKLRKLCQRVIGTFFMLILESPKADDLLENLRRVSLSEAAQASVRKARDNLMALLSDSNSLV